MIFALVLLFQILSAAAWYRLGLYNGILCGYVECYLKMVRPITLDKFTLGWRQGFQVAKERYYSWREPITGRFIGRNVK